MLSVHSAITIISVSSVIAATGTCCVSLGSSKRSWSLAKVKGERGRRGEKDIEIERKRERGRDGENEREWGSDIINEMTLRFHT